ncbi:MAG: phosphoribosyltransferase [Actinomycetia bacterium]|nr:phosphoribosyltransferase [Actinomycetes bacterium]
METGRTGGEPASRARGVIVTEPTVSEELEIPVGKVRLWARLEHSGVGPSIVLLGCGRASLYRDDLDLLAVELVRAGLAALIVDVVSTAESTGPGTIGSAALHRRIDAILRWVALRWPDDERVGMLGTGSSSAWVLWTAGARPESVRAVVTVGGRPDGGRAILREITAPVLMLIHSPEHEALERAREMQAHLRCVNELRVLPARTRSPWSTRTRELSRQWFARHMVAPAPDKTAARPGI